MKLNAAYALILTAGLCLGAVPVTLGQSDSDPSTVVARVSGGNLTLADLQKKEGGKLLQAEYQYYLNERKALEELIDNKLLADEAARRNMSLDQLRHAVRRRNELSPDVNLEASGGVTLDTVRAIAETGVDHISVGALTHSAPALDIGLDYLA